MKCPTCGNPVPREAMVCPYCESPLSREAAPPPPPVRTFTVKWDDLPGEQAADRMETMLANARASGAKAAILIHGYGSTGRGGGAVRDAVRNRLKTLQAQRRIRSFIGGEDFGPSSDEAIRLAGNHHTLLAPHVFGAGNMGITIVEL